MSLATGWLASWIGVCLPETVFIRNWRLGVLNIILVIAGIVYVFLTWIFNEHSLLVTFKPNMVLKVKEAEAMRASGTKDIKDYDWTQISSDMCKPELNNKYDYWYDAAGGWSYTDMQCLALHRFERLSKTDDALYVPTYTERTFRRVKVGQHVNETVSCNDQQCERYLGNHWIEPRGKNPGHYLYPGHCDPPHVSNETWKQFAKNGDGLCLCACSRKQNYLIIGPENMPVAFAHRPFFTPYLQERMDIDESPSTKDIDMWTIVRNMDLEEKERFKPGSDIVMDIKKLMQYAGNFTLEDNTFKFSPPNYLLEESSFNTSNDPLKKFYKRQLSQYPHLRITGAVINLYLRYYNSLAYGHVEKKLKSENKPVCYLDVEVVPTWNSAPTVDYSTADEQGNAEYREDYTYGVSVRFHAGGSYAFYDANRIFAFIASAVVYFMIPTFLMSLLTKFCLGSMSEIYYSAQMTILDYWYVFSGEVIRALTGMNAFNSLILDEVGKWKFNEKGRTAMDWSTLKKEIIDLFDEQEQIDDSELSTILNVYLECIATKTPEGHHNRLIDQKSFVDKFVNSDIATMKDWATLFDMDRRASCLPNYGKCKQKSRVFWPAFCMEKLFDNHATQRKDHALHSTDEVAKHKQYKDALKRHKELIEEAQRAREEKLLKRKEDAETRKRKIMGLEKSDFSQHNANNVVDMIEDIDNLPIKTPRDD